MQFLDIPRFIRDGLYPTSGAQILVLNIPGTINFARTMDIFISNYDNNETALPSHFGQFGIFYHFRFIPFIPFIPWSRSTIELPRRPGYMWVSTQLITWNCVTVAQHFVPFIFCTRVYTEFILRRGLSWWIRIFGTKLEPGCESGKAWDSCFRTDFCCGDLVGWHLYEVALCGGTDVL